mmetsp:Transcript_58642/g.188588  ORF Transcript_58642/g.188588 Transcript_58642/m.188588 type:complete len:262 (-) Transcript_58642:1489-2274(-)
MDLASCERKRLRTTCRRRCLAKCRRRVQTSQTSSMRPRRMASSASSRASACTLARSTPQAGASRSSGSMRAGWPKAQQGMPVASAEQRRCRSCRGSTPAVAASGSGARPSKQTRRCSASKHSSLAGPSWLQTSKHLAKSPAAQVESTTARRPGSSPSSARMPRTSAEVLPDCGGPWTARKLWPPAKADLTSGTTRRCSSSGLSKPHCRRRSTTRSHSCRPLPAKSERKSASGSSCSCGPAAAAAVKTSICMPSSTATLAPR